MSRLTILIAQAGDLRKTRPDLTFFVRVHPAVRVSVADTHLTGAF